MRGTVEYVEWCLSSVDVLAECLSFVDAVDDLAECLSFVDAFEDAVDDLAERLSFVDAVDDHAECLSFVDVSFVDAGAAMALPLDDDQVELMARALKNITAPTMQSGRLA